MIFHCKQILGPVPAHGCAINACRAIASNKEASAAQGSVLLRTRKSSLALSLPREEATVHSVAGHALRRLFVVVLFFDLSCRHATFMILDGVLHALSKQVVGGPLSSLDLRVEENHSVLKHTVHLKRAQLRRKVIPFIRPPDALDELPA